MGLAGLSSRLRYLQTTAVLLFVLLGFVDSDDRIVEQSSRLFQWRNKRSASSDLGPTTNTDGIDLHQTAQSAHLHLTDMERDIRILEPAPDSVIFRFAFNFTHPLLVRFQLGPHCDGAVPTIFFDGSPMHGGSRRVPGSLRTHEVGFSTEATREGFHVAHVVVACSHGETVEAAVPFEVRYLRVPFDVNDPSHGPAECLANATAAPFPFMHVFDPDLLRDLGHRNLQMLSGIADGDVVLDIGTNMGHDVQRILEHHPGVTVHAFEPVPSLVQMLRHKLPSDRVRIHPFGLGASNQNHSFIIKGPGGDGTFLAGESCAARGSAEQQPTHDDDGSCVELMVRDAAAAVEELLGERVGSRQDGRRRWVHVNSNCEGCEFEVMERLLGEGWGAVLGSVTLHTHPMKFVARAHERYCAIVEELRLTHVRPWGYPWTLERWVPLQPN